MHTLAGQAAPAAATKHSPDNRQSSDAENMPEHCHIEQYPTNAAPSQAMCTDDVATKPLSRVPMMGLSQNPEPTLPSASGLWLPKAQSRIPERPVASIASRRLSGNMTHRESRSPSPGQWPSNVTSGASTARVKVHEHIWCTHSMLLGSSR